MHLDIEKLAREAGFQCLDLKIGNGYEPIKLVQPVSSTNIAVELSKFAGLVLEEAAKVCDDHVFSPEVRDRSGDVVHPATICRDAIRALSRQITEGK